MSLGIAGMGWVTPLGNDVSDTWNRLLGRETSPLGEISDPGKISYNVFRIPEDAFQKMGSHPRLRRASAISRFAAAAGLAAIQDAGITLEPAVLKRIALVVAIANGGVIYTKRFYRDIVASGADGASPLLFPETVFNAAGSHLAAILGITGRSYTLVGDGTVGLLAIRMAEDLMTNDALDYCLVVGAEEADWLLCDAYRKWRLLRSVPPIELFREPPRGTILSEGAGAILIGRDAPIRIDATAAGTNYSERSEAREGLTGVLARLKTADCHLVISSANGTFVDQAESDALSKVLPQATVYAPKVALGEGVGAACFWQVIIGAKILRTKKMPPSLHDASGNSILSPTNIDYHSALVVSCGLNQQIAGLRLSL